MRGGGVGVEMPSSWRRCSRTWHRQSCPGTKAHKRRKHAAPSAAQSAEPKTEPFFCHAHGEEPQAPEARQRARERRTDRRASE